MPGAERTGNQLRYLILIGLALEPAAPEAASMGLAVGRQRHAIPPKRWSERSVSEKLLPSDQACSRTTNSMLSASPTRSHLSRCAWQTCCMPLPEFSASHLVHLNKPRRSYCQHILHVQAWFNAVRASKPQTFTSGCASSMLDEVAAADTTGGPADTCDFCKWVRNTAEDTFGRWGADAIRRSTRSDRTGMRFAISHRAPMPHRIDTGSVVTASNLFKYCEPGHGLLLFKHHDPLAFSATDIGHLLHAADCWFKAAAATHNSAPSAVNGTAEETSMTRRRLWPMLLWNTLPRAGASQFHGHAQVALSQVRSKQPHTQKPPWYHLPRADAVCIVPLRRSQSPSELHLLLDTLTSVHCAVTYFCCHDADLTVY